MLLVAQVRSAVLAENLCVKLPGTEEVVAPLASLARTLALLRLQCPVSASWHDSPDLSSQVRPCDLDSRVCTRALRAGTPDAPSPGPIPTARDPLPRLSRFRTWSGEWARCSALPAPPARLLRFDKQRQPSTWPRLPQASAPLRAPPLDTPLPLARPRGPALPRERAGGFATILPRNQPLGDSARGSPPRLRCTGRGVLLSAVRASFQWLRVCRSTLCPRQSVMHSPTSCRQGFTQPAADASSRCVTPTWADRTGTSLSAGLGASAAGIISSLCARGKSRAPLAVALLLQSARELSPTPQARIKEQTENGAQVEPGAASLSPSKPPSARPRLITSRTSS